MVNCGLPAWWLSLSWISGKDFQSNYAKSRLNHQPTIDWTGWWWTKWKLNWIFQNELTPFCYFLFIWEVFINASTLRVTLYILVWCGKLKTCLSPVRNYVREILQNTAHSSYIVSVAMSHHFIILNLNPCPSSSSSHSHLNFSNVSHFDLVHQSRKVHQLYKVSHEGKLEILIWQIIFLYKWHQIYNFSWLPTYPLVNTRKRHMTIFLVDIPIITIWVSHFYDNSRTHITAGTVSLTKPHAESEVPALWSWNSLPKYACIKNHCHCWSMIWPF